MLFLLPVPILGCEAYVCNPKRRLLHCAYGFYGTTSFCTGFGRAPFGLWIHNNIIIIDRSYQFRNISNVCDSRSNNGRVKVYREVKNSAIHSVQWRWLDLRSTNFDDDGDEAFL